ncbi:tail fiber assembly protein [Pseudomonas sp. O64]|uniref:tail fiber assembly protein n=1 Tax=unclassified Pseudomonas TaxID=196821 RepID=UPI00387B6304
MNYYLDPNTQEVYAYEPEVIAEESPSWQEQFVLLDDKGLAKIRAAQALANAPTPEQILVGATAQRDNLLAIAAIRIAPLQDTVDLGNATAADEASLKKWKQYRIAVNRVSEQAKYPKTINWPVPPAE